MNGSLAHGREGEKVLVPVISAVRANRPCRKMLGDKVWRSARLSGRILKEVGAGACIGFG